MTGSATTQVTLRPAVEADVAEIRRFGEAVIPAHYAPLIGAVAAQRQVQAWWSDEAIRAAVTAGLVVVAVGGDEVVGVGERGWFDAEPVIYKLYVHPRHRSRGIGPLLIEALLQHLPAGTERVQIEHIAANVRAAAFYEREGFAVRRVDEAPGHDRGLDVVWRSRDLTPYGPRVSPSTSCRRSPHG